MLGDVNVGAERSDVGGDGRYRRRGVAVGCCHGSVKMLQSIKKQRKKNFVQPTHVRRICNAELRYSSYHKHTLRTLHNRNLWAVGCSDKK